MVDTGVKRVDKMTHFYSDMSLLAALLDCWEPKTHMFHLTVGEMAPTLQDALLLLGLPCAGRAVGEQDVPDSWCEEFLDRFAHVQLHTRTHKEVVHADYIRADTDDATVVRHLEAYLLWHFGWLMFCTSRGNSVPKHLLPYVRAIVEAPLDEVPQYNWG
ncbi:protein MAIN-LIKE 2-like [Setaria viridis]|uniref:protein MAIN-LIKE 2-like n=1 Tax=Setaria viridis TaxID=4556 RepID=UPI003B3B04A6